MSPRYSREVKIPGRNAQELYDLVASEISDYFAKSPLGRPRLDLDPAGKRVQVEFSIGAASFSAELVCLNEAIRLDGQLSLLASAFRPKIDEWIDRWVSQKLRAP